MQRVLVRAGRTHAARASLLGRPLARGMSDDAAEGKQGIISIDRSGLYSMEPQQPGVDKEPETPMARHLKALIRVGPGSAAGMRTGGKRAFWKRLHGQVNDLACAGTGGLPVGGKRREPSLPRTRAARLMGTPQLLQFRNGPITLAEYMSEVLTNPTAGYYITRDVFGQAGDFITSPEISQMFGEVRRKLCVWGEGGGGGVWLWV